MKYSLCLIPIVFIINVLSFPQPHIFCEYFNKGVNYLCRNHHNLDNLGDFYHYLNKYNKNYNSMDEYVYTGDDDILSGEEEISEGEVFEEKDFNLLDSISRISAA